jgi:hypothetical protein
MLKQIAWWVGTGLGTLVLWLGMTLAAFGALGLGAWTLDSWMRPLDRYPPFNLLAAVAVGGLALYGASAALVYGFLLVERFKRAMERFKRSTR